VLEPGEIERGIGDCLHSARLIEDGIAHIQGALPVTRPI
jgi:hypothetical protein